MAHISKVAISEEVAEAIEYAKSYCLGDIEFIVKFHSETPDDWGDYIGRESLSKVTLDTVVRALYVGYVVEESPEEKIAAEIKFHDSASKAFPETNQGMYSKGYSDGLRKAVKLVGIENKEGEI